ncbi:hypothetical protein BJV82DRAFT_525041 [Fennellomyces sp. T-0311]|nr:hypothetical protein BJV82DRAFT_525041 [Fennellomyces sp. T-0311]
MTASSSWLNPSTLYTVFHQISFLITGLVMTLGTQWIFYAGAATGDSYLTQLAQYIGAILVGLLIPIILARQGQQYTSVATSDDDDPNRISMDVLDEEDEKPVVNAAETTAKISDGPIQHKSIMKLALLDVIANFCVTLGFSVIGSGWLAIVGTSAGLALSSFGSFGAPDKDHGLGKLATGTLLTMAGTFGYSCFYVYSDHILSKQIPPPLPARVCFTSGLYCTALSLIWISIYTLPRFDSLIHIDPNVTTASVWGVYTIVTIANATHSWNYYELIDRTGNVCYRLPQPGKFCKHSLAQTNNRWRRAFCRAFEQFWYTF